MTLTLSEFFPQYYKFVFCYDLVMIWCGKFVISKVTAANQLLRIFLSKVHLYLSYFIKIWDKLQRCPLVCLCWVQEPLVELVIQTPIKRN